ncbi:MAG: hypothetical protein H6704_07830 [Myxococcales bacterium]|nr:hypothetical protein [Myxococcales bacterium]
MTLADRLPTAALCLLFSGCLTEFPDAAPEQRASVDARLIEVDWSPRPADGAPPAPDRRDAAPESDALATPALDGAPAADTDPPRDAASRPDGADDAEAPRDATPPPDPACVAEACNGRDDDCDGAVDEDVGLCGPYVETHCEVWLAFAGSGQNPGVVPTWGDCPGSARDNSGNHRCVGTRRDGRFRSIRLSGSGTLGGVNGDAAIGLRFVCSDESAPELAEWIQTHCSVFLGWTDLNLGPDNSDTWGPCPGVPASYALPLPCVSTTTNGTFHALRFAGDVDGNDDLGVAFRCVDDAQPARAAALAASAEVFLAQLRILTLFDDDKNGDAEWGLCPGQSRDNDGDERCIGTFGDQRFHRLDLAGNVDYLDVLGISLRARRAP